jgi:hypothetical protein
VRLAATVFAFAVGTLAVAACSNQGEGERCDQNASNGGNDDCQDGLQCTSHSILGTNSDICCPPDRTQATTAACAIKNTPITEAGIPGEGGTTPDSSTPDSSTPDSSTPDSSTPDAPAEAASEGGTDAGAG